MTPAVAAHIPVPFFFSPKVTFGAVPDNSHQFGGITEGWVFVHST